MKHLIVVCVALAGCGVPQVEDRDVHPVTTTNFDSVRFHEGDYQFPAESWELHARPDQLGWDTVKLKRAEEMADSLETAAWMVIHRGVLVSDWGATDEKYITQSMRKGLLNSLYGIYEQRGAIDLEATLADLNISDDPPLRRREREATVKQLLQSTSGIYHSALYEEGSWKRNKPARGTHRPGEAWYYNNWGFNALGTVFEQRTGQRIGEAFQREIAAPIGMEDYAAEDVTYLTQNHLTEKMMGNQSEHPAYMFSISARDLARYGLLYLNGGAWNGTQIVPSSWIDRSWEPVDNDMYYTLKFGYLWWVFEDGIIYVNVDPTFEDHIYFTSGNRGHALFVIPYLDLVVVHRVHVQGVDLMSQLKRGMFGAYAEVDDDDVYRMLEVVRQAHPRYQDRTLE